MVTIYADGSCKADPGPMAIGVSLHDNGQKIETISAMIRDATNNVAEYGAAIEGRRKGE